MKTLMFYSYKGGSGRTVAAANVAAALAKLGKKVAIVDLDFEAPGLHHVLSAEQTPQFRSGNGVQQYLRGDMDLHDLITEALIDVFADDGPLFFYDVPDGAQLLYLMASPKVAQVGAQEPQVPARMKQLIDAFQNKLGIDYVILDSASGIRDAFSIAADVSDEMLIFFRWSKQHVQGTLKMVRYMKLLKDFNQAWIPFKLVASAAPRKEELASLPDEKLSARLMQIRQETEEEIEKELVKCQVTPATVFHEVPEMVDLKWMETVTVFRGGTPTTYETLARALLDADQKDNE